MITTVIAGADIARTPEPDTALPSPAIVVVPTPTPKPHFEDEMKQYVYDKFGDDFERAFSIINCESKWNAKAFNDNTVWGGVGQDRGIWQINNKFHPVSDDCAYDYKCSTDYAYRMYKNDNYSFERWTCGL